jgi:3-deoxy-D-manno-octulosonate 8-phosphate phosphatase (KDO 8-P phosphatase)
MIFRFDSYMKSSKSAKNIKILLTDVDCVLTDGGMYYTSNGDVMKKFHTRDGMGVNMLRRKGIPTIIVTKEKTPMVKKWAKKMNIEHVYDGIQQKETILKIISKKYNVKNSEIGYIGDDINDIELLKLVGFSATPHDGISEAQKIVHYICKKNGGEGAFREISDILLRYMI